MANKFGRETVSLSLNFYTLNAFAQTFAPLTDEVKTTSACRDFISNEIQKKKGELKQTLSALQK